MTSRRGLGRTDNVTYGAFPHSVSYFDPLPCERPGRLRKWLGTRRFRPCVAGGAFWQRLGLAKKKRWTQSSLQSYVRQSKILEVAHFAYFVFQGALTVLLASREDWLGVIVLGMLNLWANIYPLLVVRYNWHLIQKRLSSQPG